MVRIKSPKKIQRSTICVWIVQTVIIILVGWFLVTRVAPAVSQSSLFQSVRWVNKPNGSSMLRQAPVSTSIEPPGIISRNPEVKVTTDVRGNLGPPSVMIQESPGTDWLKDRWQAASDMHGTAIPGVHWVMLEFPYPVTTISKVILDWEAALARDYRIDVSSDQLQWTVLFDSHHDSDRRTSEESGQSPGVKSKTPLHIVHTVVILEPVVTFTYLRVYIRKSAMGWGVSLWQLDVYGR
jgi:F5/8 type C domain